MHILLSGDKAECGFTLIEALVAIAILAISIGVVLQQFSAVMNQNFKTGRIARDIFVQTEIVNRLKTVNPVEMSPSTGMIAGIGYEVHVKRLTSFENVTGLKSLSRIKWQVALFQITVDLLHETGEKRKSMVIKRVGWKKNR